MQEKNIEKEIKYDEIIQMEMHAKKYLEATDKKEFLKNVSAYEQKIILLNSDRPYDVLNYLDELDLKNSRLILNELTFEEIKKILDLFTAEDKKNFYKNFSDLSLVNQFIIYDNSSSNYIKDLTFDRKVELINSSNKETVMSSAKIYETMPTDERKAVTGEVTSSSSISTLEEAVSYVESGETTSEILSNDQNTTNTEDQADDLNKETKEEEQQQEESKKEEQQQEEQKEGKKEEETKEEEKGEETKEEEQKEEIKEEEKIDLEEIEDNPLIESIENEVATTITKVAVQTFEQVKQQVEQMEIEKIKQDIREQKIGLEENVLEQPIEEPENVKIR